MTQNRTLDLVRKNEQICSVCRTRYEVDRRVGGPARCPCGGVIYNTLVVEEEVGGLETFLTTVTLLLKGAKVVIAEHPAPVILVEKETKL